MSAALVRMADNLLPKEIDAMARRRYQRPSVLTSKTRRPYFYFRYREYHRDGTSAQKEQFLGWCDELKKIAAGKIRDEWLKEKNNVPLALQSQIPFVDFVAVWKRTTMDELKERTRMQYESALRVHILPRFGKMRLCNVTREAIQEWKGALLATMQPDSVRNLVRLMHGIFEKADELGYWDGRNPAAKVKIKAHGPERETITLDEYRRLLARLSPPWDLAARIALETGLRIGEIRGLEWRDIDLTAGLIHVRRQAQQNGPESTAPKTRKSTRPVPIGALADELRRMKEFAGGGVDSDTPPRAGASLPVPNPGDDTRLLSAGRSAIKDANRRQAGSIPARLFPDGCYSHARDIIVAAGKAAGITARRFGWHTLRHLHSDLMREAGADVLDVRDQLGHSRLDMTARYTRNEMARREAAVRRVQEMVVSGGVQ